jgi:hypothetical protein
MPQEARDGSLKGLLPLDAAIERVIEWRCPFVESSLV